MNIDNWPTDRDVMILEYINTYLKREASDKYICPYCRKESSVKECYLIKQKTDTIATRTRGFSHWGKHYIEKTEIYRAYNIRICKRCIDKRKKIRKYLSICFYIIIPLIISFICGWNFFIPSAIVGVIPWFIGMAATNPKEIDIIEAAKMNAIHKNFNSML